MKWLFYVWVTKPKTFHRNEVLLRFGLHWLEGAIVAVMLSIAGRILVAGWDWGALLLLLPIMVFAETVVSGFEFFELWLRRSKDRMEKTE
jgi:hypothetical protein